MTKSNLLILCMLIHAFASIAETPEKVVNRVHNKALTVDTHCDTPMSMLDEGFDVGRRNALPGSRVDFPRMRDGGLDAMFFAAFTSQKERTAENTQKAYEQANRMIGAVNAACEKHSEQAEVALTADCAERLEKEGKRAIYIGMENGFPLGTDISRVEEFYNKGVRYITLSHSANNDICDSSSDRKGPEHGGLSKFGKKVVRKMNKLGMLVDVSHISDDSFYDVIKYSKAPVFASHSSVRSIAGHNRNLSDNMIKALAKNGGVIQICLLDVYVRDPDTTTIRYKKEKELRDIYYTRFSKMSDKEKTEFRTEWRSLREKYPKKLPTVSDYVDHIDYVKNLVGIDHVGIGSDFDGGGGIDGCADVSQMPNITREMLDRGYTEAEVIKVWGGNFFRVMKQAETLSKA